MSNQHLDNIDGINDANNSQDETIEPSPTTKLQRRRKIEDLFEEKRMREELGEFDLL
ncbi:MAG: hypothetical protein Q8M03_03945 [Legionella sp.]|nr:hypothetical protein [Legionella sp.]